MADTLHDTVLPQQQADRPGEPVDRPPVPAEDDAHAPGHHHLGPPAEVAAPTVHDRARDHTVVDHRPGHVHKG